ncbi:hypothetical protein EC968_001297 [Mortierella alpina]|nr:hypothetical protein EC968_001297 [Mortierella alpina]
MKLYMDHEYAQATSSGDNSDLEDHYGEFDPDELLPSSDSDLVSHPSDNEDHQLSSSSLSPAYSATRQARVSEDDDVGDGNEDLPSFSLSSQDLDQRAPPHCDDRMQDDFLPVERSDFEYSTRPHSPLSQHSDVDDGWVPMHLVYPSMTLSPASAAAALAHQDRGISEQLAYHNSLLAYEESHNTTDQEEPERLSDVASLDQSQDKDADGHDKGTAESRKELPEQPLSEQGFPEQGLPERGLPEQGLLEQGLSHSDNESVGQADRDVGLKIDKQVDVHADIQDDIQDDVEDPSHDDIPGCFKDEFEGESQVFHLDDAQPIMNDHMQGDRQQIVPRTGTQPPAPPGVQTLLDELCDLDSGSLKDDSGSSIVISPPWSLFKATCGFFGLLSMLVLAGFLAAEYHHASTRPAHVSVSEIHYSEDNRMAVVQLHVFTADLRQIQGPSRPPKFHMRILPDNKAWSIEDAPKQPQHLFAEPFVSCAWGGWCSVYLSSLQRRGRSKGCSNATHYLHIWFANGTRTSDQPPEVFANAVKKPCSPQTGWTSDDQGQENSNGRVYDMWTKRWRQVEYETSQLLAPWRNMHRDHLQAITVKVQSLVDTAFAYTQRSFQILCKATSDLVGRLSSTEDNVVERATMAFQRARRNAKIIKGATVSKAQKLLDRACFDGEIWDRSRMSPLSHEHIQTLKTAIKSKLEKLPTDEVLRKADHLLFEAENKIEAALQSERVRRLSKKIPADKIKQIADRVLLGVEGSMESMLRSNLAQNINGKTQRMLDRVKATPTGSKVIREAKAIKSDAKQLWKDTGIRLRRAGVLL